MSPKARTGTGSKKIVIIEDEETLRELLKQKLARAGFSVEVAGDGVSGFALIKKTFPNLVLLDMLLPGMNGFQVLEKMKEAGFLPSMPVLIISNSGQDVEVDRALAMGVRDCLIKVNFDPKEVLARVEALLATKRDIPPASREKDAPRRQSFSKGAVLIVEDDFLLQGLLERKFVQEGYHIEKALDVAQAQRLLDSHLPDIILLDLVLPDANGLTFLAALKKNKNTKKVPVVIVSNLGQREEIDKGLALGAADYIVKANMSPGDIVKKVETLLKKKYH